MRKSWVAGVVLASLWIGCGLEPLDARTPTLGGALTGAPELLELETLTVRRELYREVLRSTAAGAGQRAGPGVLLVVARKEILYAAPALEGRTDLFQSWDGGATVPLDLAASPDFWSEEPRESLQGLSEREAAALVASALLQRWGVQNAAPIQVDRAVGAPYAAAYVDGVLRVNPALLYLAAAGSTL